jgi:hypothetical protein
MLRLNISLKIDKKLRFAQVSKLQTHVRLVFASAADFANAVDSVWFLATP